MNPFETLCAEVKQLLNSEDETSIIKKIIDLTLDTQDLYFYRKTYSLFIKIEQNTVEDSKFEFDLILDEILNFLKDRPLGNREILLEANNVVKHYNQGFTLGPINLSLHQGQILGLVGENGNGKTTLLRTLCGELAPTSGTLKYHLQYKDLYDLRTQLVYIPQRTDTWRGSLLSNLQFTAASYGMYGEENDLMTELVIIRMGLRKYRNLQWAQLSSGYKMRFELARMLLRNPKILLIDEPLANLDILAQQVVLDDFREIAQSLYRPLGVVLSSQQLYEVEKTSDQVIFLQNGLPKNLHESQNENEKGQHEAPSQFVIEFETDLKTEEIKSILSTLKLQQLQFNGGTYVATFPIQVTQDDFLKVITENQVQLTYYRNITHSTRRFFLS